MRSHTSPATPLDRPHFTENYVLRQMGYKIARKHAMKRWHIALGLAFLVPAGRALVVAFDVLMAFVASVAVISALAGLVAERWLFFAQATHVSTIDYRRCRHRAERRPTGLYRRERNESARRWSASTRSLM
jgi:hypothetical protein